MLAFRGEHAEPHRGALAGVLLKGEHLQLRPLLRDISRHRERVVAAAVIDDEHLVLLVAAVQVGAHSDERRREALLLVEGRER